MCLGLNVAERSTNDLVGVDKPVRSVSIRRVGALEWRVFLLGARYVVDAGGAVQDVRAALDRASSRIQARLRDIVLDHASRRPPS